MLRTKHKVGRNELCPCKSGLKYKSCHGDAVKLILCKQAANEKMLKLITIEKFNKASAKINQETKNESS